MPTPKLQYFTESWTALFTNPLQYLLLYEFSTNFNSLFLRSSRAICNNLLKMNTSK